MPIFRDKKRSYVPVWNWIQRFGSYQIYNKKKRISVFLIDKLSFRLEIVIIGYGSVLNEYIVLCLKFTYQKRKRETYLLLMKNSLGL
ncbi:MAG: hypothetical protein ACM3VV_07955 [Deltaproteobacteria bacterium]